MKCLLYVENVGIAYIRGITVRGNYKHNLNKYGDDPRRTEPERKDECSPTIINMTLMLCMVLDKIPHGRLESFVYVCRFGFGSEMKRKMELMDWLPTSWDVNSFFSWKLTDKLQARHPNLKKLYLRDGDDGPHDRPWLEDMRFSNLRSLSWGNIATHEVLAGLNTLISLNAQTLKSLSISLRSFSDLKDDYWGYLDGMDEEEVDEDSLGNFLAGELFKKLLEAPPRAYDPVTNSPMQAVDKKKRQLDLENLLLEKCPMDDSTYRFLSGCVDLPNLQRLTLRRCPETHEFLDSWISSGDSIRLKSVEFLLESGSEGVVPFLNAFTGLENLYLLFENLGDMTRMGVIFESIYHHEETLRRLVIDVKRHGKTMGIPIAHVMGIKTRLKIKELGIAFKAEEGVRSEFRNRRVPGWTDDEFSDQMGDLGIEFLCSSCNSQINVAATISTIHIRNLRRPVYKTFDDPFVDTKSFFRSKTFRHRKADAESIVRPLTAGLWERRGRNLEAIIIGPVDENKAFENLGAATEFSCFLVDYVNTRVGPGLPVLNAVSMGDLIYFEVPCEVTNVRW